MVDYYSQIYEFIRGLGKDVVEEKQKERIAFSSLSRKNLKFLRLVWITKNPHKPNNFRVWIRKEEDNGSKYPTKDITKYKPDGGYKYPTFKICSDEDLKNAMLIIEFAYRNL